MPRKMSSLLSGRARRGLRHETPHFVSNALRVKRLLAITGSTRRASTNSAAVHTMRELPGAGEVVVYDALAELPAFNPDDDREPLPDAIGALRAQIEGADAVVFCTPEYAGTLPGSLKNLLDWTVGGGEMYGKPVAWINVAAPGRGGHRGEACALARGDRRRALRGRLCPRLGARLRYEAELKALVGG